MFPLSTVVFRPRNSLNAAACLIPIFKRTELHFTASLTELTERFVRSVSDRIRMANSRVVAVIFTNDGFAVIFNETLNQLEQAAYLIPEER